MNTEAIQDQEPLATGQRLRQAREDIGLSQQEVAEYLCLKVSTVRDIEDDRPNLNLASTFLHGYIRSYARLVHLPKDEIALMIARQAPMKIPKVTPMQSLSLNSSTHKKRDEWLMRFTWLVLFVVISLTGTRWWQNYQAKQQEINHITDQTSVQLPYSDSTVLPLHDNSQLLAPQNVTAPTIHTTPETNDIITESSVLVMNFTGDCWLEVCDADGKKLFIGLQHKGTQLNLTGQAPYKLKIGAPAAVRVQYQGKQVDLSRFIQANQIARLTIAA